jgi:hypothetical protein
MKMYFNSGSVKDQENLNKSAIFSNNSKPKAYRVNIPSTQSELESEDQETPSMPLKTTIKHEQNSQKSKKLSQSSIQGILTQLEVKKLN